MVFLFAALHPFRGQNTTDDLLPKELRDQDSCDSIVDSLLLLRVDFILLGSHLVELFQGLLVNIVVYLAPHHFLK